MIFLDFDNFRQSLFRTNSKRFYDFGKFSYFIIEFIRKSLQVNCTKESLIRTYAYTGEYTESIINKIKSEDEKNKYLRRMEAQQKFLRRVERFNFFELTTLPLKYENGNIFQKGIDVRMAVDLVYHAFSNHFDSVVICSGDIDLVEAVKLVKRFGKKVIIMSHPTIASKELIKQADYFINIAKLKEDELNLFSRIKND